MLPFKLVYSEDYFLPIGTHVFPAEKYKRVHDRLIETKPPNLLTSLPLAQPPMRTFCSSTLRGM